MCVCAQVGLEERCTFLRDRIKTCQSLVMRDTLRKMKRVLRRLGAIDGDNVVQMKGRVACEINTADELLVTELVFNGVFNDLDAGQAAALLSCLVYTDKGSDEDAPALREELGAPFRALQDAARRIAQVRHQAVNTLQDAACRIAQVSSAPSDCPPVRTVVAYISLAYALLYQHCLAEHTNADERHHVTVYTSTSIVC